MNQRPFSTALFLILAVLFAGQVLLGSPFTPGANAATESLLPYGFDEEPGSNDDKAILATTPLPTHPTAPARFIAARKDATRTGLDGLEVRATGPPILHH
ncbi:MAG: hypothetical protein OQK07_09175 [Rhodospirillales bacterium]|nr:hypothetical protein [Rhodospirillales bacterium]